MWLVLCSAQDIAALWAYEGLKRRGLQPIELLTDDLLSYSLRFQHQIGADGVFTHITLADSRTIESATVQGTLNRLSRLSTMHMQHARSEDRLYAEQELHALYLSWLYALPGPLVNRPTPQGLSGSWRHLSEWIWLAGQAGLTTPNYQQSDYTIPLLTTDYIASEHRSLIVFAEHCFGSSVPPSVQQGAIRLANASDVEMLGVDFHIDTSGRWLFVNATPLPDLRIGGQALLEKLANKLRS